MSNRVLQLSLPQQSFDRLEGLRQSISAPDHASVIGAALRLYEALACEAASGNEVIVRSKEGDRLVEYRVFEDDPQPF